MDKHCFDDHTIETIMFVHIVPMARAGMTLSRREYREQSLDTATATTPGQKKK